jgi:hypothetical protein
LGADRDPCEGESVHSTPNLCLLVGGRGERRNRKSGLKIHVLVGCYSRGLQQTPFPNLYKSSHLYSFLVTLQFFSPSSHAARLRRLCPSLPALVVVLGPRIRKKNTSSLIPNFSLYARLTGSCLVSGLFHSFRGGATAAPPNSCWEIKPKN